VKKIVTDVFSELSGIIKSVPETATKQLFSSQSQSPSEQLQKAIIMLKGLIRVQQDELSYQAGQIIEFERDKRSLEDTISQKDKVIDQKDKKIISLEFTNQELSSALRRKR